MTTPETTTETATSLTRAERVNADITSLLRARNTLLWIVTPEEVRVERAVIEAAAAARYTTRIVMSVGSENPGRRDRP